MILLALLACPGPDPVPDPEHDADIFAETLGDPIPGLDAETLALYEQGREVMDRPFTPSAGLGPSFNADSCAGCHQAPVSGGSAPRYRDFWLVQTERWDGAVVDAGTNGESPIRNLYNVEFPSHGPDVQDAVVTARRTAPPMYGMGLLAFVPDAEILQHEDPDDADGDGISGRANYEQGRVGRFGVKAQASSVESFNRGAMFNQMGITSNPLFHAFPEEPEPIFAALGPLDRLLQSLTLWGRTAWAQVSAPGEPTRDDDEIADPEMTDSDQLALLVFSTYIAAPMPKADLDEVEARGAELFAELDCVACHVPRLDSTLGPIPVYSDLLVHDMGPDLDDGMAVGLARTSEWRTAPLWGVALTGPWLNDGRAETLQDAISLHGGEAQDIADAYAALPQADRDAVVAFLEALGPDLSHDQILAHHDIPLEGEAGAPRSDLSADELALWEEGRLYFDHSFREDQGLGARFNADSCRACHQDPVLGGAGGIDTNVIRYGFRDPATGEYQALDHLVLPRSALVGDGPWLMPEGANVVELRQPPTLLGIGYIDAIPDAAILANEDPEDLDGDGISGRARVLSDGSLGRYGWKANVPTVYDFVADAGLNEVGLTLDASTSLFTVDDDGDAQPDPELSQIEADALAMYLSGLAAPPRQSAEDDALAAAGEQHFTDLGCVGCHMELDGVPLYSDLLLHDIAPDPLVLVDQEEGLLATEYRTAPLWGASQTPPYLHDGSAETFHDAIVLGHWGEAQSVRAAYLDLSEAEQAELMAFLDTL